MLNASLIKSSMRKLGLTQTALAHSCSVSKEAVSNWLSGESVPRPSKITQLATVLQLTVEQLLPAQVPDEPVIAYRMRNNRPMSSSAKEAGDEIGRHLRQLLPFTEANALFDPPQLRAPQLSEDYACKAAKAVRASLKLGVSDVLTESQLFELFHDFGARLVPVFWGGDKDGHENAMSVYLPDIKSSWVIFNLGCRHDDFKYWLAHEYGHCLTIHTLRGDDGERFAEMFAQHLLFPDELAAEALATIKKSDDRLAAANWFSGKYNISVVTVVRSADRVAKARKEEPTGLDSLGFYIKWKKTRAGTPSVAKSIIGTDTPTATEYILKCQQVFRTPVFLALARWQKHNGGRSPSFISSALNINLADATELSHALWTLSV